VRVAHHETEDASWVVAQRATAPELRPFLLGRLEGWEQTRGVRNSLREVPFPGIPLILDLGSGWEIEGPGDAARRTRRMFVAGIHASPTVVTPHSTTWTCIELRLTPLAARRILGLPMHELVDRTIELDDLVPAGRELGERLRETGSWERRFELVEDFLVQRLADSVPPPAGMEWCWRRLQRTGGRASIGALGAELGWSHKRLIARFRDHIGPNPKTVARVIRFDHTVTLLRSPARKGLGQIAYECGYADQAHLNREFRQLAATTPTAFLTAGLDSGGVAA
jgi:AraC-like DNA-binding protein